MPWRKLRLSGGKSKTEVIAESGAGPIVVKAANWLTHLEYEWESPVWKHWIQFFSAEYRFVRYDERGCGMSDWKVGTLSLGQWTADLDSIIEAARPAVPVTLLGISQGASACAAGRGAEQWGHCQANAYQR
jgi:pimeloyl-ACP methyl ester carboxylesterase